MYLEEVFRHTFNFLTYFLFCYSTSLNVVLHQWGSDRAGFIDRHIQESLIL